MKKKIKQILFWASIPLVVAGLTITFRISPAQWFGYVPILQYPQILDLGEWNCGEAAVGHFQIKNGGKRNLTVEELSTSCSCATVEREIEGQLSRVQRIDLSPGEEAQLIVSMRVAAQPGESQGITVYFRSNDPVHPQGRMDVIIPRVGGGYFAQPSAIVFGPLLVGDKPRRTVDFFNNRVADRQVENVRSTHPERFTVKLLPLSEEDKQRNHRTAGRLFARIEVTPCLKEPGTLAGEIYVTLVKEEHRTPPISVLGEVISPVVCRPAMLVLPRRVLDQTIHSGDILIFHRREKPIEVGLESLPEKITAEVQAIEGRSDQRRLHVEWHPSADLKTQLTTETRLRLRVRADGEETKLEVPVLLAENRL